MQGESDEEISKGYGIAIGYYNKALLSLKILFEAQESVVKDQAQAVKLINEIEIPVALNLALCYLKTKQYHYGIKYASQVIDKGLPEKTNAKQLDKAYYRRALCYYGIGDNDKSRSDTNEARRISDLDGRTNQDAIIHLTAI
jgi:tetratricopeptide (TPR) repeat protein